MYCEWLVIIHLQKKRFFKTETNEVTLGHVLGERYFFKHGAFRAGTSGPPEVNSCLPPVQTYRSVYMHAGTKHRTKLVPAWISFLPKRGGMRFHAGMKFSCKRTCAFIPPWKFWFSTLISDPKAILSLLEPSLLATQQLSPEKSSSNKPNSPFFIWKAPDRHENFLSSFRTISYNLVQSRTIINSCRHENLHVNRAVFVTKHYDDEVCRFEVCLMRKSCYKAASCSVWVLASNKTNQ